MEIWHQKVGKDMERLGRTQGFLEPHHPQRGQRSPQLLACWRICFESGDLKYFKEIGPFNGLNGSFDQLSSLFHFQPRIHRAQTTPSNQPWEPHIHLQQKHDRFEGSSFFSQLAVRKIGRWSHLLQRLALSRIVLMP